MIRCLCAHEYMYVYGCIYVCRQAGMPGENICDCHLTLNRY